jgi:hypothetical protein
MSTATSRTSSPDTRPLVVKIVNGQVRLHSASGNYLRTICSHAAFAVLQGDQVHVSLPNGSVRVFTVHGQYVRTL